MLDRNCANPLGSTTRSARASSGAAAARPGRATGFSVPSRVGTFHHREAPAVHEEPAGTLKAAMARRHAALPCRRAPGPHRLPAARRHRRTVPPCGFGPHHLAGADARQGGDAGLDFRRVHQETSPAAGNRPCGPGRRTAFRPRHSPGRRYENSRPASAPPLYGPDHPGSPASGSGSAFRFRRMRRAPRAARWPDRAPVRARRDRSAVRLADSDGRHRAGAAARHQMRPIRWTRTGPPSRCRGAAARAGSESRPGAKLAKPNRRTDE